jgi:hypothetical protein
MAYLLRPRCPERRSTRYGGDSFQAERWRAAFALADKIKTSNIRCDVLDRDDYGRHIATCFLGEPQDERF